MIGEWFGPSTVALVLRDLSRLHRRLYGGPLEVLVCHGNVLYMSEASKVCRLESYQRQNMISEAAAISTVDTSVSSANESNGNDKLKDGGNSLTENRLSDAASTVSGLITSRSADIDPMSSSTTNAAAASSSATASSTMSTTGTALEQSLQFHMTKILQERSSIVAQKQKKSLFFDPLLNRPPEAVEESQWKCSLVVLIPLRLGEATISQNYIEVSELI